MAAQEPRGPRVRVAALMLLDNRVVVVRHRLGGSTYHLLPGGGVNYRETLRDALVREVAEETGLDCAVDRPLIINDTIDPAGKRHVVNITFLAHVTGGSLTDSPADARVEAVETVDPAHLTELDLRPPIAHLVQQAITDLHGFTARYAGSLFTPERS